MKTEDDALEINDLNEDLKSLHYDDRESILSRLDEVIRIMHHKAVKGRVTKPENEKVKIAWIKALAYTCSVYNQIKRDVEMDELKEDVEEIKSLLANKRS